MFTEEQIYLVNKTSRNTIAIGPNAIVPAYVLSILQPKDNVLDFGAGRDAIHTKRIREAGFYCVAYDFGQNDTEYHQSDALTASYDIVMVSNVINVQLNETMLRATLRQIWVSTLGAAYMNYPLTPRKANITTDAMYKILKEDWDHVVRIGGTKGAPLWKCSCK